MVWISINWFSICISNQKILFTSLILSLFRLWLFTFSIEIDWSWLRFFFLNNIYDYILFVSFFMVSSFNLFKCWSFSLSESEILAKANFFKFFNWYFFFFIIFLKITYLYILILQDFHDDALSDIIEGEKDISHLLTYFEINNINSIGNTEYGNR